MKVAFLWLSKEAGTADLSWGAGCCRDASPEWLPCFPVFPVSRPCLGWSLLTLFLLGTLVHRAGTQVAFVTSSQDSPDVFCSLSLGTPTGKQFLLQTLSGLFWRVGAPEECPREPGLSWRWQGLGLLPGVAWTSPVGARGKESAWILTPCPEIGDSSCFSHGDTEAQPDRWMGTQVEWKWSPAYHPSVCDSFCHPLHHPAVHACPGLELA